MYGTSAVVLFHLIFSYHSPCLFYSLNSSSLTSCLLLPFWRNPDCASNVFCRFISVGMPGCVAEGKCKLTALHVIGHCAVCICFSVVKLHVIHTMHDAINSTVVTT